MTEESIITWNLKSPDGLQSITIRTDDKAMAQDYANWALAVIPNSHIFPDDQGGIAHTVAAPSNPVCPIHHKQMTKGQWGWYCKTKTDTGWCKYKPEEVK